MAHLLHIDCSAMSERSVSKELAAEFRRVWDEEHPGGQVIHRDLGRNPVPHLDEAGITARFLPPEEQSAEQKAAGARREGLVSELIDAEAVLISAPMYNWTIPSTLKAWIDHVLVAGRTLTFGADNPLAGRPVTVLLAYGGGYLPGAPQEPRNYADPYLRMVFEDELKTDLKMITAQLTLAGTIPGMDNLVDKSKEIRAEALASTQERALKVASALAVA